MKNFRIGIRLGLGFMVVVVLLIAIAFIGITRLGALNDGTRLIVTDRAPKVAMANKITDELNKSARFIRNILLLTDANQIKFEASRLANARKEIADCSQHGNQCSRRFDAPGVACNIYAGYRGIKLIIYGSTPSLESNPSLPSSKTPWLK